MSAYKAWLWVGGVAVLSGLLSGCSTSGTSTPVTTTPSVVNHAANLAGTYLLLGSMPTYFVSNSNTATNVAVSFQVSGNAITGSANVQGVCTMGGAFAEGFVGAISGTVNTDGTFTAGFTSTSGNIQTLTITGTVPASAQASWNGKFALNVTSSPALCPASVAATFVAMPVAALGGTFTGSGPLQYFSGATTNPPATGATYSMSASLTQNGLAVDQPLTGALQVTGFPCFTHETTSTAPVGSSIESNVINANYVMDDGAQVQMAATVNNVRGTQVAISELFVYGDSCAGQYAFSQGSTNSLLLNQ